MTGQRLLAAAGWLFVDLLLVLVIVQFGAPSATTAPPPPPPPTPTSTTSTTSTPPPPPALDPVSVRFELHGDAGLVMRGDPAATQRLLDQIVAGAAPFAGRTAALVLVFGTYGGCPGCAPDAGSSVAYAGAVVPLFHAAAPQMFPAEPNFYRDYLSLSPPPGTVIAEIFFFSR